MDWKKTFTLGTWAIHAAFLIAVLAATGCTLYALRLAQYQESEEANVAKILGLIENFKNNDHFEQMAKYLTWAQSDKAQEKITKLTGDIAEVEDLLEVKATAEVRESLRIFNSLISNTSGMSNPGDALKVLSNKVVALEDIASSQNYRNIASIAQNMKERLSNLNSKNVGGSIQVSYLKSDIQKLQKLVTHSTLQEGEKNTLLNRFQSMNNELELLSSLNSQSRDLKGQVNKASLSLAGWVMEIEKKAEAFKSRRYEKQNQLIIMLAAVVGFMITAWLGLCYLFRWQKIKLGLQVELEVKNVIEKGIVGDQRFMMDHYSEVTRDEIIRLLDLLKVKLNLGSMLHHGLPFAGCMIDQSFKINWHNQLFLDQFYLSEEEVKSDSFNWDYVRDYLSLEADPVYEALANKIAGIYPVKIKQDELASSQPFEMYVTPVFANREERVMVFFYPLVSSQEAIDGQVKMATSAINRFVELWDEEKLDEDELRLLERDFSTNDLETTYESLSSIYQRLTQDKNECLRTINNLEKENQHCHSLLTSVNQLEGEKREIIKREFQLASELRNSFINTLEKGESLAQINKTIMQQNDDLRTEAMKMGQQNTEMHRRIKETMEVISQLDVAKADFKKLKFDLLEVKTRLISMNTTLFAQLPVLDEAQQRLANKYKDELARLDVAVATLDKKISFSDALIAKLQMMHEKQSMEQINFSWQKSRNDHEIRETLLSLQKSLSAEENKIIETLKSLGECMKSDYGKVQEAQDLSKPAQEVFLS